MAHLRFHYYPGPLALIHPPDHSRHLLPCSSRQYSTVSATSFVSRRFSDRRRQAGCFPPPASFYFSTDWSASSSEYSG
jgi:hypothetical protein